MKNWDKIRATCQLYFSVPVFQLWVDKFCEREFLNVLEQQIFYFVHHIIFYFEIFEYSLFFLNKQLTMEHANPSVIVMLLELKRNVRYSGILKLSKIRQRFLLRALIFEIRDVLFLCWQRRVSLSLKLWIWRDYGIIVQKGWCLLFSPPLLF